MEPSEALAELSRISSQVRCAVIFDRDGEVVGTTLEDDERARRIARAGNALLAAAEHRRPDGNESFAQLEAGTASGSVFVVRDGEHGIVATTAPEPTVGLVFYDLKRCLRDLAEPEPKQKNAPRKRAPAKPKTPREDADAKS
jgi:predicted regulator of Ras-like GTPase activity (Roadblock/LC7/MglB family)